MTTKAQNKANRQNSKKSTGPKTAEGKAVVSQNAVKHGLFAAEAVVKGEDPADYQAYHDQYFAELLPNGMVESMLAERVVSLSWRLQRAERMQNQSIEDFTERHVTDPLPRRTRVLTCHAQGIPLGDHRCISSHLSLGRIAIVDWSNNRVLERLFMYERRIESSLYKTINKLKRYQLMRMLAEADIRKQKEERAMEEEFAFGGGAATRYGPAVKNGDLKKQSQFEQKQMHAMSLMQRVYGDRPALEVKGNKANSKPKRAKRSQSHAPAQTKGARKRKKKLAAANSLTG